LNFASKDVKMKKRGGMVHCVTVTRTFLGFHKAGTLQEGISSDEIGVVSVVGNPATACVWF